MKQVYVNIGQAGALKELVKALRTALKPAADRNICIVCIGSDRSTGDSLGPLVGYKLSGLDHPKVHVFGTLDSTVNAKNLDDILERIKIAVENPFIIAVDACLGRVENVGCITVGSGSIKPGSGVNKDLTPVGDMYISGIVNFGGFMDFLILQNTKLSLVMKMADLISVALRRLLRKQRSKVKPQALLNSTIGAQ